MTLEALLESAERRGLQYLQLARMGREWMTNVKREDGDYTLRFDADIANSVRSGLHAMNDLDPPLMTQWQPKGTIERAEMARLDLTSAIREAVYGSIE